MYNWIYKLLAFTDGVIKPIPVLIVMSIMTFNCMSAMDNNTSNASASADSIDIKHNSDHAISRNLFVQYAGPSLGIGVGYDQRFKPNSVFGFSAGIAFTNGSNDDDGWFGAYDGGKHTYIEFKGITLPWEVNAIMGKRASKFELGIGATPCILDRYELKYQGWHQDKISERKGLRLNIFGTLSIGYRLQRKSGFFLRAGLTFIMGGIECSPFDGLLAMPNLSLGYTIR